jgi:hypothetical protein
MFGSILAFIHRIGVNMVRELLKKRTQGAVSLQKDGTLSLSQTIMERLGYIDGDVVVIAITETGPLSIGLRIAKAHETDRDYRLGYLYRSSQGETSGGKISCTELIEEIQANIVLPQRLVFYSIPPKWSYDILILPSEIEWNSVLFDDHLTTYIPSDIGVYRLLSPESKVLKIGQGNLRQRFQTYLHNNEMRLDLAQYQYCLCKPRSRNYYAEDQRWDAVKKEDAMFLEKLLIGIHYEEFGKLPEYNTRWA